MEELYADFLSIVPENLRNFIEEMNTFLLDNKCKRSLEPSANGYLVRYTIIGKSLLNYVFRKGCVKIRIYANNVSKYQHLLEQFPVETKKDIANALNCKKLAGIKCSPTCPAGYTFIMDGIEYKKCKNLAFLPALNDKNNPIISKIIAEEIRYSISK